MGIDTEYLVEHFGRGDEEEEEYASEDVEEEELRDDEMIKSYVGMTPGGQ